MKSHLALDLVKGIRVVYVGQERNRDPTRVGEDRKNIGQGSHERKIGKNGEV